MPSSLLSSPETTQTESPAAGTVAPAAAAKRKRLYLTVPQKFSVAVTIALAWTALSVWLSSPWLNDLAELTNWPFAIIAIGFIAYVPGFMNAFMISSLSFDRRPERRPLLQYPGITILVAAYNEAAAINDTLTSLARPIRDRCRYWS